MSSTHWDEYWATSAKSTISDYDKRVYGQELTNKWRSLIEVYSGDDSIVDLACGNGDIALIAYSVVKNKKYNNIIYGIDYATIRLNEEVQGKEALDYISWLPNTKAEMLPIEDNSIGLVLSQFGFEYTDVELSIIELARIIKVGGHISFLIHHDDSFISKQTKIEMSCYQGFLIEESVFNHAKSLLKSASIEKGSPLSEKLRNELNQKISRLQNSYGNCEPLLAFITQLKRNLSDLSSIEEPSFWNEFDELKLSFETHYQRLSHMMNSVYSKDNIGHLEELFTFHGFKKINLGVHRTEVGILGWWLNMEHC